MIEAENDNAEIVHPYAIGNGEADERAITTSAQTAAETLLTPGQIEWAQARGLHLLPAPAHQLPNVQLVGIARLRYRPHTKATAAWFAKKQEWGEWRERYRELAQSNVREGQGDGGARARTERSSRSLPFRSRKLLRRRGR